MWHFKAVLSCSSCHSWSLGFYCICVLATAVQYKGINFVLLAVLLASWWRSFWDSWWRYSWASWRSFWPSLWRSSWASPRSARITLSQSLAFSQVFLNFLAPTRLEIYKNLETLIYKFTNTLEPTSKVHGCKVNFLMVPIKISYTHFFV